MTDPDDPYATRQSAEARARRQAEQVALDTLIGEYVMQGLARREAERRIDELLHPSTFAVRTRAQMAELHAPHAVLEGWLYGTTIAMLGSPGGIGKTALALGAGSAMYTRQSYLGAATSHTRTLYVAGEGAAAMEWRIRAYEEFAGLPHRSVEMDFVTGAVLTRANMHALSDAIAEKGYGFVVVDTAATLSTIKSENDNSEVSDFIGSFRDAVHTANPRACGLILHHATVTTDRSGRSSQKLRGASAWRDDTDTTIMLEGSKDSFRMSSDPSHAGKQRDAATMTLGGLAQRKIGHHIVIVEMTAQEQADRAAEVRRVVELMVPGQGYGSGELQAMWGMDTNNKRYQDVRTTALDLGWIVKGAGNKGKYTRLLI